MSYKKKHSKVLMNAYTRINALKNIDPDIDLGGDLTVPVLEGLAGNLKDKLDAYNDLLAQADKARSDLKKMEKEVRDATERIFLGIGTIYGRDSDEYQMVGGVKKSERKTGVQPVTFVPETTNDTSTTTGS